MLIQIEKIITSFEIQQSNIYFCSIKYLFHDHQNYKKDLRLAVVRLNI